MHGTTEANIGQAFALDCMRRVPLRINLVVGTDIQKYDCVLGFSINYPDVSRDRKGPPTGLIALERVVVE